MAAVWLGRLVHRAWRGWPSYAPTFHGCQSGSFGSFERYRGRHREATVRPVPVVFIEISADDETGLGDGMEQFAVEEFIAHRAVESFDVAVLLGAAFRDRHGGDLQRARPVCAPRSQWAVCESPVNLCLRNRCPACQTNESLV